MLLITDDVSTSRAEYQLYRNLLSNYNRLVRPVKNSTESLKVLMRVHLQQLIDVDERNQVIELNVWLKYIWNDYRLSWDPTQNENITSVRFISGAYVWQPDILLYNSADESFDSTYQSNVVAYNDGEINWIPPGILRASCIMDITWFPFDDQTCYLKFGSWTYNGFAINLQVDSESGKNGSIDLSDYISNGEWLIRDTIAVREESFYDCCIEPYPTLKFYINLRRRTLFYGFNLIVPSLLISVMTLLAFALPPNDISEKISFQTTILLSVCFFLTIVSEIIPSTSDSVPLIGMFFSTLTIIVAVSTTFTIMVMNVRYRQTANCRMSKTFRRLFLNWLPWLLVMKRSGYKYSKRKVSKIGERLYRTECLKCTGIKELIDSCNNSYKKDLERTIPSSLVDQLCVVPIQKLDLERKVGDGMFTTNKSIRVRVQKMNQYDKYLKQCIGRISDPQSTFANGAKKMCIVKCYLLAYKRLKIINERMKRIQCNEQIEEDWNYAAMVLDRLCMIIFCVFFIVSISAIFLSPPYINA